MPYVITTRQDIHGDELSVDVVSRRAVATLEEARSRIRTAIHDAYPAFTPVPPSARPFFAQAHELGARSGGTVGPLPDGTTIEVGRIAWEALMAANGMHERSPTTAEIIDAYNARS